MVASPRLRHGVRAAVIIAVGVVDIATLSACTGSPTPTSSASASHAAAASDAPKRSAAPTAKPTPKDPPTPVALTCDQVVTAEQLYSFNPNYGTDPGYAPAAGSKAAKIVADKGVACGFLNQTSNAVIEVAIAKPSAKGLTHLKNAAVSSSHVVPTYGVPPSIEGYFTVAGDSGQAQIFTGGYWVVLTSKEFAEPGDPAPLVASVLQNLPQG